MSHITKIDLHIKDLEALRAAIEKACPGMEFREGQKTFKWYGRFMGDSPVPEGMTAKDYGKCDHAIAWKAGYAGMGYEAGLVARKDGNGYHLVFDNWAGGYGLCDAIGRKAEKIKQAYAAEITRKTMARQGFRMTEHRMANGSVQIRCQKVGL